VTGSGAPLAYRTVLFDLDGTLIDSIELILASHRHATLEVLGASPSDDVLRRGIGTPLLAQMRSLDETRADALVTAYRAFNHRMHDELLRPYEGLLELCTTLREEGAALGVVTSKSLRVVEMAFARLAFAPLLDVVVTSDQTEQHKPRPEPIFEALRRLGRDASGACYVGDSPFDLQAAHAAGVDAIGVSWGAFAADELRAEHPVAVARTPEELSEVLHGRRG
jgi:pyrophosphatase PpaX